MKKKQINKALEIHKKDAELEPEVLPYSKMLLPIRITCRCVLQGMPSNDIRIELKLKGFDCNMQKVYRLIRIAKKQIMRHAERDLEFNYKFIETNLLDMHLQCVSEDDKHLRLKVLDKLMMLWSLNVQRIEQIEMEVTPEKLAEYERMIFGG